MIKYKELKSGIIIPYSKKQEEKDNYELRLKLEKEYHEKHRKCPDCGSTNFWQTCLGCIMDINHPDTYYDSNQANCSCGWKGTVHDRQ